MSFTKFSVLFPTHDRDDMLEMFDSAINSVLNNSLKPYEVIVIVDGPVRKEFERKIKIKEKIKNVKVVWLEKNIGLSSALNIGLKYVSTEYVFRADGDDLNVLNRFEIQMELFKEGYGLIGGAILEKEMKSGKDLAIKRCPQTHSEICDYAMRRNPLNHMTVGFKLDDVLAVGGYPNINLKEDWALWVLMLARGTLAFNSSEILVEASADIEMYKRRGGFKAIHSEYIMQKFLIKKFSKRPILAIFDWVLKASVLASPPIVRSLIYRMYLRDKL